jgi:EmrB/QacA subfamily drug resistance transporter
MSHTQRWTLAAVCAATAMLMLDIAVVNTALSAIASDLGTGLSGLQWVIDAYTLPLAATVLTAGALADSFGRKRLFSLGLVVFTATSLLCAASQSIGALIAARAAQGLGAALMFAVSLAVLSHAFPRSDQRGKALAAYGATMAGSFAVGPLVGGALTSALDWRWIFLINLPLGLACLAVVRRSVRESRDPRAPRVDRAGLVTLTGGLFLLVFALLRGEELGWGSAAIAGSFAGAVALLAAFLTVEARIEQPMLPLRLFRDGAFSGAQVAAFGISASLFAMWLYMTLYLQQILGLSAIEAGLVYFPGTIVNFVVAGAMAPVGQKVAPRTLLALGLALIGAGLALLTLLGADSAWWLFLPGLLVAMVGTGILNPIVSQVALSSVAPEQSGLAAGVNDMFRQAGIAVGVAGLGVLVPAQAAFGGEAQAYVDGFHEALWAGAALAFAAAGTVAVLMRRGRVRRRSAALAGAVLAAALLAAPAAGAHTRSPVTEWNAFASDLVAANLTPAPQTYTLAATQIAVHDALNAIDRRYEPYAYAGHAPRANEPAAVAAAAHDTLVRLVPQSAPAIEVEYAAALAAVPGGPAKRAGIATGQKAAAAILARRSSDDLAAAIAKPYTPGPPRPGVYQPTPPLNFVILAGWGELPPFALKSGSELRSPPPPATGTRRYARDYAEVKAVGSAASTARTTAQTETGRFWYDVAAKEWNLAAQHGLAGRSADDWRAARTLAVLDVSLADAVIASFDTKFHYDYWRPITAIRSGDHDGNRATRGDAAWEPLCVTPPFPEYNSTHAATGAAAASALARELGDRHTFTITNPSGATRTYRRFSAAAYEEGISRIYCGIHFRSAMDAGFATGALVADRADGALMRRVR